MTSPSQSSRKHLGARPLIVIVFFFALSGGLRFALLGTEALAADGIEQPGPSAQAAAHEPASQGISDLIEDLQRRKKELDERERQIEERLALVEEAEEALRRDLSLVEEAEARLQAAIEVADDAAADDLGRLIAVYESMKSADAAALFQAMTPEFAAGFLSEMRAEAAASIMSEITPEFAYAVSVIIAGRNADIALE